MKLIIKISAFLLFISYHVLAQHKEIDLGNITKIEVYHIYGNINLVGTDENVIRIDVVKKRKLPENFKTLQFELKESNSNLDLNIAINGNTLTIFPSSIQAKLTDYQIHVPRNLKVKVNNVGGDRNKTWSPASFKALLTDTVFIKNMSNDLQIEVSLYTVTRITDITGPIVAESNFGDIYVKFSSLSQDRPSSIKSFSGQINLDLPKSVKCDIVQSSFSGKFKSEIELNNMQVESPDPAVRGKTTVTNNEADTKISGQINNGGVKLYLRTFNSDINLFKLQ